MLHVFKNTYIQSKSATSIYPEKGMLSSWDTNLAAARMVGSERSPLAAPAAQTWRLRRVATLQLGAGLPKPQPPSRVCAMPGPAHLPVLNAQQPSWQSESCVQDSKTVACALPGAFPLSGGGAASAGGADESSSDDDEDDDALSGGGAAAGAASPPPPPGVKGILSSCETNCAAAWIWGSERSPLTAPGAQSGSLRRLATLQLGAGLPNPQPPSRV